MSAGLVTVEVDQVRAWELYSVLGGDCAQVAAALGGNVTEPDVVAVAQRYEWPAKLRAATAATGSLLAVNRARNLSQALRLQRVLDGVLADIEKGGEAALKEWTTVIIKDAQNRTGGPLMQLASAAEIAQKLTYRALGDTPEKAQEDAKTGGAGSGKLMQEMTRALEETAAVLGQPPSEVAKRIVG
jgi:hypothetical protein